VRGSRSEDFIIGVHQVRGVVTGLPAPRYSRRRPGFLQEHKSEDSADQRTLTPSPQGSSGSCKAW